MPNDDEPKTIHRDEVASAGTREATVPEAGTKAGITPWEFFNSSLGLWLLSAIFITAGGALFTQLQHARAEHVRRTDAIERLDLEISYRFSRVLVDLFELTTGDVNAPVLAPGRDSTDVARALEGLNTPPTQESTWLYPEYREWPLPALMAELRREEPDSDERTAIETAIARVTGHVWRNADYTRVEGIAGVIQRRLMIGRWRDSHFYFVDCTGRPFC